jgi:hypothetical protein
MCEKGEKLLIKRVIMMVNREKIKQNPIGRGN